MGFCTVKKVANNDGIAGWKIDSPIERVLAKWADKSEFGKYLYVNFYRVFDREYFQKGLKFIDKNIAIWVGEATEKQRKLYIYDMVYSLHRFGCMFDEYFFFGYAKLNTQGRESFVTDKIRWDYYSRMNLDENKELFNNKRKAYETFRNYYHRDLIEVIDDNDKEKFRDFAEKHVKFIVKPIYGSGGKGIFVASSEQYPDLDTLFLEIRKVGPVVIEEIICQTSEMDKLHPQSLNSVRVPTLKLKDRVVIFRPVLRIGRGDSVVDNASSGGVLVAVDADTGICCKEGVDELGGRYLCHPNTGVTLPGFQIPRWDEAKALAIELAGVVEGNHYIGWDLALTDNGWVMVEGNPRGQFIMQIATKQGIKEELEAYIAQM